MKKNIVLVYGIAAFVAFTLLLSVFSIKIHLNTNDNIRHGGDVFDRMGKITSSGYIAGGKFIPAFNKNVKATFNYDKRLKSIVIKDKTGDILYCYTTDPELVNMDAAKKTIEYNYSNLYKLYKKKVKVVSDSPVLEIEMLYKVTDRNQIVYAFRSMTLYVVVFMIFTIAAFIVCFVRPARASKNAEERCKVSADDEVIEINFDHKPQDYGFSDIKYFDMALDDTLLEAKSMEKDVVVAEFRFNGKVDSETWRVAGKGCEECFSHNDSRFEVGTDEFAAIFPDADLDEGIKICRNFIKSFGLMNGRPTLYAGLSSKNGREIDAVHLVGEARAALLKCTETDNIVALKTDPALYAGIRRKNATHSAECVTLDK